MTPSMKLLERPVTLYRLRLWPREGGAGEGQVCAIFCRQLQQRAIERESERLATLFAQCPHSECPSLDRSQSPTPAPISVVLV